MALVARQTSRTACHATFRMKWIRVAADDSGVGTGDGDRRLREEERVACFQMRGRAAADAAAEGQYYDGVGMAGTGIGEKMHPSPTQDGDTRHFFLYDTVYIAYCVIG